MTIRAALILASVLSAILGCQSSVPVEPVGTAARPEGTIVGGREFDGLPAVGAFALSSGQHWCTGTLVAPRVVLTAAHCLVDHAAGELEFRIGPVSASASERLAVRELIPHPSYRAGSFDYDIGVVLLDRAASVPPMRLIDEMDASWADRELFFVGYGIVDGVTREGAGRKRSVVIPIESVGSDRYRYRSEGKNTCTGDSGGPAFWQSPDREWRITGVVSHGDAPCLEWGVNTRVDVFRPFLAPYLPPDASPGCDGVSFEGECEGTVLRWCESERLQEVDCADRNQACGYDDENGFYDCVGTGEEDPCNGENAIGRCDEQVLIWCEDEQVHVVDCEARDQNCVYDAQRGYFNCL